MTEPDCEDGLPSVRLIEVGRECSGSRGFHLSRSKWDPYPWVSRVDDGSVAHLAGMKPGDCILEVNSEDVLGYKIADIAQMVRSNSERVTFLLWNAGVDPQCDPESLCCGPMPINLQKLSACMTTVLTAMECPICFETIQPPSYQCTNGHLVCAHCHDRSERCSICRLRLCKPSKIKSLFTDQVYQSLLEAFGICKEQNEEIQSEKIRKIFRLKNKKKCVPNITLTQLHTNKLLDRLAEKSSSAENLSNKSLISKNLLSVRSELSNLTRKSLSATEIFRPRSPCFSRTNGKFYVNKHENVTAYTPPIFHGSYECLTKSKSEEGNLTSKQNDENQVGNVLYYCPFSDRCHMLIQGFLYICFVISIT